MSAAYAWRMNIHVERSGGPPLQVAVVKGMVCTSEGTCNCKVLLKLQEFSADLMCPVNELADAHEVIGEDWLSKYSATLSWQHRCCVIAKGSQRITLFPSPEGPEGH